MLMDWTHRPHPYQGCETIRTARNMNDQFNTVGAGQDVFTRVSVGRVRSCLNREVQGGFLSFLGVTRHDLREPVCNNGNDHVVP
jgi:hypothetical protein